jgi:putative membrane protein
MMMFYRTTLVIHILAIISWMAGILYLLRLFVNHRDYGERSKDNHELLLGMEKRLFKAITIPAMIVSYIAGLAMLMMQPVLWSQPWLHIKLTAVVLLTIVTVQCHFWIARFSERDPTLPSSRTFRILNEVPTILMIIIVTMVILRPWTA